VLEFKMQLNHAEMEGLDRSVGAKLKEKLSYVAGKWWRNHDEIVQSCFKQRCKWLDGMVSWSL